MSGPWSVPISDGLRARLTAWAATFNEHFDWDTGWDTGWDNEWRRGHRRKGLALNRQLSDELGPGCNVSFSL